MDEVGLYFGWRVAILAVASLQILCLGVAIAAQPSKAGANGWLAAFLIVLVGVLTPYTIGFAGAYDAWRWLTFAPFAVPLALPPLLYAYTHARVAGRLPARFGLHLIAPGAQFAYLAAAFALPMELKWAWYTGGHRDWVEPLSDAATLIAFSAYAVASLRLLRDYRRALADQRSDDDRFAAIWLSRVISTFLVILAAYAAFTVWDWASGGIDFFQETGLYLGLAAVGIYLGIEGWRHAGLAFPVPVEPATTPEVAAPDWTTVAAAFDARLRAEGWAREPDLGLPILARRLGTNTGRLSRAVNQGLGVNFSAWVNGVRAEAVAAALDAGSTDDLLNLAFDAGFSSKASFNRAFHARFGTTPSRYRRDVSLRDFRIVDADMRRAAR